MSTPSQHRHAGASWLLVLLTTALLALAGTAAPALADDTPCAGDLQRITVGGAVAPDDAVVLTAQAFEADVDGFALATWDAADGVVLTAVEATTLDGDRLLLPVEDSGTVEGVSELRFCGSRDGATAAGSDDDVEVAIVTQDDTEVLGVQLLASPDRVAASEAAADRSRVLEVAIVVALLLGIGVATTRRSSLTTGGRR
jgi:hypothetical protein